MQRDSITFAGVAGAAHQGARFKLSQRFYFDAAHTLRRDIESEGSLRIHGHTYEAEVTVAGRPDPDTGMVMDLAYLRREIARVREMLDHRLLDEVPGLGAATLENLCSFIARELAAAVPELSEVMVERRSGGDRCVMELGR
jgi:6-pyruvoyltetrahydropterin/6-carboxytetrahydropterin synthase